MGTANYKRFARVEILKSIAPKIFLGFLGRFRDYFSGRGLVLPKPDDVMSMPYDSLAKVFLEPDSSTPTELSEALYLIDEMSTHEGMEDLLIEAKKDGTPIAGGEDLAPADVAVQVWMASPSLLERRHRRKAIERSKSFDYFHSAEVPTMQLTLTEIPGPIKAIEKGLDDWFEPLKCGRGCRVTPHPHGEEVWFTVEHGDQFLRAPARDGVSPAVQYYRPEKSDIVVYSYRLGEIRINARTSAIKDEYRKAFGKHLFGDANFFSASGKYTLEPLFTDGADALSVVGIEGIKSVKLVEVQFDEGGSQGEVEIRKAHDLFETWRKTKFTLGRDRIIAHVKFEVQFSGSRKTRTVTLRPPGRAAFGRDADSSLIEEWLAKNEFTKSRAAEKAEEEGAV